MSTNLFSYHTYCFTICINNTPISPGTKTIKPHVCLATNPTALLEKIKMASTTLPAMTGKASVAFPLNLLGHLLAF